MTSGVRTAAVAMLIVALAARAAAAQPAQPAVLDGVGVSERIGARIPLDLWFSDATGHRRQLRELFADGKPVLLVLAYVRCKLLCSVVLRGLSDAVRALPLELGRDYRVITASIDPHEDAASAAARRRELVARMEPSRAAGWSYLVGAERPIRTLAEAIGFGYAWDSRTEQYAHPAVVVVITPDGTISRYMHGVVFPPADLAGALRTAAAGELGPSSLAESVLRCFRFDPAARANRERIERYLKIAGGALVIALGSTVLGLFLWERRRRRS